MPGHRRASPRPPTARRLALVLAGLLAAGAVPVMAQDDTPDTDTAAGSLLMLTPDGGVPEAGRYSDSNLLVDLEYTLGDGWADGWGAPGFGVILESDAGAVFAIADVDGYLLARPCMVEDDDSYPDEHAEIELTPEGVMDHWEINPLLENEGRVPVTVAGTEGYQLDVRVDLSGLGRRCVDGSVPLWGEAGLGEFSLDRDMRARIILFETDGVTMALVLEGPDRAAFDEVLELGMPIVDSLSVVPREEPDEDDAAS